MEFPGFIGASHETQVFNLDQEATINFYVETADSIGATAKLALCPSHGVEQYGTGTIGPGRANVWDPATERQFAVIGSEFGEIDVNGVWTVRGAVATDANPATISTNGITGGQILICSGGNAYLFTPSTNVFAAVAALAGKATMGAFLDGFFLVLDAATSTVWISDLFDGAVWDPTQYFSRSIASDPIVSMVVSNRYIRLLGTNTSESWYNAGTSPIPFIPDAAGLIQFGCAAAFSPEVVGSSVMWLGQTENGVGPVLRMTGLQPEQVSTFAIENALSSYTLVSDAIGDTYSDRGHTFYLLTMPNADVTWCYDSSVPMQLAWTQRGTWIAEDNEYVAWRPLFHAHAFGRHTILDRETASIYHMSSTIAEDVDSRVLRRVRRAPAIVAENKRLFYSSFELDLDAGLGLVAGQGSDPQVMMRMSSDGGRNWGNEIWRSAGKIGEYSCRVKWLRCGSGSKKVFEVAMTDPVPWRLTNAYLEMPQGPQQRTR